MARLVCLALAWCGVAPLLASGASLVWQVRNPVPTVEQLNDLTGGPGGFAAVGDYGVIVTSPDGARWTLRSAGVTAPLRAVTSNGGRYVAVGDAGALVTSTDGATWQSVNAGTTNHLTAVGYFNGTFFVTAQGGTVSTSSNGTAWSAASSTFSHHLNALAVGAGRLVIYGNNGLILTTTDGHSWSSASFFAPVVGGGVNLTSAAYVGGRFYVVAGGTMIFSSTDGLGNWTQVADGNSTRIFAVQDRLYGSQGFSSVRRLLDNGSWQTVYSPLVGVTGIGAANGLFFIYGANGSIATSPDATVWMGQTSFGSGTLSAMTFGGGRFVAADNYNALISSVDAATWTVSKTFGVPYPSDFSYALVSYGDGRYYSPLGGFKVAVSADGVTWTQATTDLPGATIAFGAGRFVGVSAGNVYTSSNALTWTLAASSAVSVSTGLLRYLNGLFVAFGASGRVDTSPDGIVWTQRTLPIPAGLRGVAAGAGRWVGVAASGAIVTSSDGVTWVARGSFRSGLAMRDVVFGAGQFVALGILNGVQRVVATSPDGETWTEVETPRGFSAEGVAAGNGVVLFVGGNSLIFQASAGAMPAIQTQPVAVAVTSGQSATLSVVAQASGAVTYQWFEGGSGDGSKPVAGATAATFTTPALVADRAYWVRVTSGGVAVDSVTSFVTMRIRPTITREPTNALATAGGSFTLGADAGGVPAPEFQWYEGARGDVTRPVAGATAKTLTGTLADASKQFWVRATNPGGTADSVAAWAVPLNPVLPPDFSGPSQDIAFGGGRFVVLRGSSCLTSTDGRNWTNQFIGDGLSLRSLIYGDGKFVAVGDFGGVAVSNDGVTWSARSLGNLVHLRDVAFGAGRFVAVGAEGVHATSTDGQTWTMGSALAEELIQVTFSGGQFSALSAGGTVFNAGNGQVWTATGAKLPVVARLLVAGNGRLVAMGTDGTVFYSSDGITWRVANLISEGVADNGNRGLFFDGTRFVLLAQSLVFFSADGAVWTYASGPGGDGAQFVGAAGGGRIVVGSSGATAAIILSENGTTWSRVAAGVGRGAVMAAGGRFFAAGGALTSVNGQEWQATDARATFTTMVYGNGRFLGLSGARVSVSEDGVNWSEEQALSESQLRGLTFGNGRFVVVGDQTALYSSVDGVGWTAGTADYGGNYSVQYQGVAFGAGRFVAMSSGQIHTSLDGQSWTRAALDAEYFTTWLEFHAGRFWVSATPSNLSSTDGVSFTPVSSAALASAGFGAVRGLGLFVRAASGVTYSGDGLTYGSLFDSTASYAAFGNGTFLVSSDRFYRSAPVPGAARIVDQSQRLSADAGQIVTLSVTVTEGLTVGYQWFRGARGDTTQPISGGTTRTLEVPVEASAAAYWVRVSAADTVLDSATIRVVPEAPPVIVQSPVGVWVRRGVATTLVARAEATPSATFQWYVGQRGDVAQPLTGETSPTLRIPVVTGSNRYWVRVTNSKGAVDSEAAWVGATELSPAARGSIRDAVYAQNRFVAVGDAGLIVVSDDGDTWREAQRAAGRSLVRIAHAGGRFVAVGERGTLSSSPDGVTWTMALNPTAEDLVGVAARPGRTVAVGKSARLLTSADGLAWQAVAPPTTEDFLGVATDGTTFVALAANRRVALSTDGITWVAGTIPTGLDLTGVIGSPAGFLVTSADGNLLSSLDGVRWTPWASPAASAGRYNFIGVAEGGFLLVGDSFAYLSADGAAWRKFLQPGISTAMALGGGRCVAFGISSDIYSSVDGVGWSNRTALPTAVGGPMTFANGRFATASDTGAFATSLEGVAWTVTTEAFPAGTTPGVVAGAGLDLIYRAGSTAWTVRNSAGEFQTRNGPAANVKRVVFRAGRFVALAETGAIYESADLSVWTLRVVAATPRLSVIDTGETGFLAVGAGVSAFSTDGVTWVQRAQGPAREPVAFGFGRGRWVAVLNDRTVSVSADGQTWSPPRFVPDLPIDGTGVQFAEGLFSIGIFRSADGVNWINNGSPGAGWAYGNGILVAPTQSSTVLVRSLPLAGTPVLRRATENLFAVAGQTGSLAVEAEGTELTYQWFSGASGDVSQPVNGVTGASHTVAAGAAAKFFWVRLTGARGTVDSPTLALRSAVVPVFTVPLRSALFGPTQSVSFTVAASGAPAPSYRWFEGEVGDVSHPLESVGPTLLYPTRGTRRKVWVRAGNLAGFTDSAAATAEVIERIHPVAYGKIRAIAFGGGRWVGVGDGGQIMVSADGAAWSFQENRIQRDVVAVAFGAGRFVAVGPGGCIVTSADGVRWQFALSPTAESLSAIGYFAGKFVAVGGRGTIVTSTDGLTWSSAASGTLDQLTDVASDGAQLFALAKQGALLLTTDGVNWVARTIGSGLRLTRLALSSGQFLATSENGFTMFSADGISWTRRDLPADVSLSAPGNVVASGGGFGLMATPGTVLITASGVSWTRRSVPTNRDGLFLLSAGGRYFLMGTNSRAFFSSTDLNTWTDLAPLPAETVTRTLFAGDKTFVVGNDWTLFVDTGVNGWRRTGNLFPGTAPSNVAGITAIAFGEGRYVAAGGVSGKVATSTDGLTWEVTTLPVNGVQEGVVFAQGKFVCVGTSGVLTSPDGLNWTPRPVTFAPLIHNVPLVRAVTYGAGLFVAAGNEIITSPDGVTWTVRLAFDGESFRAPGITYGAGQFCLAGGGVDILVSGDGVTWSSRVFDRVRFVGAESIAYGGGLFVAGNSGGGVVGSPDAMVWRDVSVTPTDLYTASTSGAGAAFSNSRWTLTNRNGVIFRTALPPLTADFPFAISSPAALDLAPGESASFTVTTANGTATGFSATGLPVGFTVNTSTGVISGSSNVPGAYTVSVRANSAVGFATATLHVSIAGLPTPPAGLLLGDGGDDLVAQNRTTGERAVWQMAGTTVTGIVSVTTQPVAWVVAATADFNRDGKTDWLWHNRATGQCALWFGQGTSRNLPALGREWLIVAAGDFNGDAWPDFVVQNLTTGECGVWLLNNGSVTSYAKIGLLPVECLVASAADFSGDGQPDLITQNTLTGECGVWPVQGLVPGAFRPLLTLTADADLVTAADLGGGVGPDLVVQNRSSGERGVWFVSSLTLGAYAPISATPGTEWRLKLRARQNAQTLAFAAPPTKTFGEAPFELSASATSALPVAFTVVSGPASVAGATLTISGAGVVTLRATQPGDSDFAPAPAVERVLSVAKAPATVALSGLAQTYSGTPRIASVATAPAGLAVAVIYGGTTPPPLAAGSFAVVATVTDPNYTGSTTGTLVVVPARLTVRADDKTRPVRSDNPTLTLSYSGFVNGETADGLLASPTATTTAINGSGVGQYPIRLSGGSAVNYELTLLDGVLTVTPPVAGVHVSTAFTAASGAVVTISNTVTYVGALTSVGWQVLLPAGWTYGGGTNEGGEKPVGGAAALAEWRWTTIPPSPFTFTYDVQVPLGTAGERSLAALVLATQAGESYQSLVRPDPLVLRFVHSADTDRDWTISLSELVRMIELYNTRFGSVRTGRYRALAGTVDGFDLDALAAGSAPAALIYFHSADTNRDGRIGLPELTRVIELYNQRTGTVRQGRYRADPGNAEDGLAPAP